MQVRVFGPYAPHSSLEFGFDNNGKYEISIAQPSSRMVFGLMNKAELAAARGYAWDISPNKLICEGRYPIAGIQRAVLQNESAVLSGAVPERGVYTPFYYGCSSEFIFYINLTFMNGASCLDYRYKPSLICTPLFVALFGALFVLWLVNWFTHFTCAVKIHFLLTCCFGLAAILRGLYYGFLSDTKRNGFVSKPVYYSYHIFSIVNNVFFFLTLLLAAKGWYITTKKLKYKTLLVPSVFGLLYVIGNALMIFLDIGLYSILVAIVTVVCLAVYVYYLIRFINDGTCSVSAHLVVIQNNGIDPKSTPVYQKYKMYKMYSKALITYCVCVIITLAIDVFAGSVLWLPRLADDITYFILMAFLFWIFMIRQKRNNGYLMFEDGDVEEFSQQDVESMNLEAVAGGQEWDENTPLPPQPYVTPNISAMPYNDNRISNEDEQQNISVAPGTYENPVRPQP